MTRARPLLVVALALALLAGCSGRGRDSASSGAPDSASAREALRALVERHHATYARGDLVGWGALLTHDAVMIAADPHEYIVGRDSIVAELRRDFEAAIGQGLRLDLRSTDLRIGLAPGAPASWVSDVIGYDVAFGGDSLSLAIRFTGLAERRDTSWTFRTVHYSRPITPEVAAAQTPEPHDPGSDVASGARAIADLVAQTSGAEWSSLTFESPETFAIGPEATDRAMGGGAVGALLARLGLDGALARSVRCGTTTDGNAAWWTGVFPPSGTPPRWRRVTLAFVRDPGGWRLAQAHVSVGIKDQE